MQLLEMSSMDFAKMGVFAFKLIGFNVFTVVNDKSITKPIDLYFFLQSIAIGIFICYISVIYHDELLPDASQIVDVGNYVTFIAAILIALISMITTFIFRHDIWQLILIMFDVELKVCGEIFQVYSIISLSHLLLQFQRIGYQVEYIKFLLAVCLISLLFGFFIFTPLFILMYFLDGSIVKMLLYFYSTTIFVLNVGSATIYIMGIFMRLRSLKHIIMTLLHLPLDNKLGIETIKYRDHDEKEILVKLNEIYGQLMTLCGSISRCYGLQVMLGFGLVFFYTIFCSFAIYKDLLINGKLENRTISSLLFCIYSNFIMTCIIWGCSLAKSESKETCKLINRLLKCSKDPLITQMLLTFNSHVSRCSPNFTCGLFAFDWKLVCAVSHFTNIIDTNH